MPKTCKIIWRSNKMKMECIAACLFSLFFVLTSDLHAANKYTITATAGSGGSISPSGAVVVNSGGSQSFTITPNTGYHIAVVTVDGISQGAITSYTFTNVRANHTIAASFSINTYTITATAGIGGSISPSDAVVANYGGNQTFTITPNTGYHVADVMVDGVSQGAITSFTFTNVTANHAISATFAINTYTITATAGSDGTISPSGGVVINYGDSQTFTITPNTGYHVADVTVEGVSQGAVTSYTFSNVTSGHTITAGFAINPILTIAKSGLSGFVTVTSDPSGINCGTDCTEMYDYGAVVALTAVPSPGTTFTGWSGGGCTGTGNCTLTLNGDTTVTTTFTAPSTAISAVSAGRAHTVAIRADGTLWAWGTNEFGQLGDETTDRLSPVQVGADANWVSASAGYEHTVAIKSDGTLWAWGQNGYGQLGDGTTTDRRSPVQVGTSANWVSVSAGFGHTIAIKSDGTLWSWGWNCYGQLGDGTTTDRLTPVQVGNGTNWSSVSVGIYHTVAMKRDGTLWAWGWNGSGQLGDGTTTDRLTPVQIGTGTNWSSISAGIYHTIAIKNDGTLWAWGWNECGQLGDGTTTNLYSPVQVGTGTNWSSASAGYEHTIAIKNDGTLWAWGRNEYGQLGDGTTTSGYSPVQVDTGTNWSLASTGIYHTVAIKRDGTLWAWGRNSNGQSGGTASDRSTPVMVGTDTNWSSVSASYGHTVVIKGDGTLWAWGLNDCGQLGDGTTTDRLSPVRVGAGSDWSSVSAGSGHTVVIRRNGTLWAWGYNIYGQLGDGTTTNRPSPIQVGTGTNWSSASGGIYHTLAIKSDGTLWAWGWNGYGQLGDGTTTDRLTPVQAGTGSNWSSVSAGWYHTAAIKNDGTLWAWGRNDYGQLGDGTTTDRPSPVQVDTGTNWSSVSVGIDYTVAMKHDGTLWAWGGNGLTPVQVGTDTNWSSVSAGWYHTVAMKSDGTLWAWGENEYGQLGDGTTTDRPSPVQAGYDANWSSVSAAFVHTVAIKNDGTLYTWGSNSSGQLGDAGVGFSLLPEWTFGRNDLPRTVTVLSTSGGTVSPSGTQTAGYGSTLSFTVSPDLGYHISSVIGCNGTLSGSTYTAPVTINCTVSASFAINTYAITATAGNGGTVTPTTASVNYGGSRTFIITPNNGYSVADVSVDGVSQGAITSYTFTNVTANHTISASFAVNTYTITASAGSGGSISPSGSVVVNSGGSRTFTITPNSGYHIADVTVDGVSQGAIASYTFTNVTTSHAIGATFVIIPNTIVLTIDSPPNGATINRPDVMVTGTITNPGGYETGVTVNGVAAIVYGNQFVANHVPLQEGSNTITATATDINETTATASVTVNAVTTVNYVRVTADTETGISPLDATLRVDGTFNISASTLSATSPAQPEILTSSADQYKVRMTAEGIYYFTVNLTSSDGNPYQDTVAIGVMNLTTLDNLLRSKWNAMTTSLGNQDVTTALTYTSSRNRDIYQQMYTAIVDQLPAMVATQTEFNFVSFDGNAAIYELVTSESGGTYSYDVVFVRDANGLWVIQDF